MTENRSGADGWKTGRNREALTVLTYRVVTGFALALIIRSASAQPLTDRLPASTMVYVGWSPNAALQTIPARAQAGITTIGPGLKRSLSPEKRRRLRSGRLGSRQSISREGRDRSVGHAGGAPARVDGTE